MKPVRVAILWHMHQPYYRDLVTGKASLPWVRLHAVKDYHPMAAMLKDFPGVQVTFNYVPSLVKQILEYTQDGLRDDYWDATVVPAADLSARDRDFILRNFFMANWELTVKRIPRYAQLLEKRGFQPEDDVLERAATLFSVQDFLDLQVWFNLVWFHPIHLAEDRDLAELVKRGRDFNEKDKALVLARQIDIMGRVVPLCRSLAEEGRIELCTSPFYHPILPLVTNTEAARESLPHTQLPDPPFVRPEDAVLQLDRALAFHEEVFGSRPVGLWPSEGSVSEEMLSMVAERGFRWMATDEEILYRTLEAAEMKSPSTEVERCLTLYRPYVARRGDAKLEVLFRDHFLSDAVGFVYGHWEAATAAADLVDRLDEVATRCRSGGRTALVSIILDGENAWEYYHEQGYPFLKEFYGRLERSTNAAAVTVSRALDEVQPGEDLPRLFAGSWIDHNFGIWIGHAEDRRAWELLGKARNVLDGMDPASNGNREKALEEILIAEGSDWCWWYGDENTSANDAAFDELYRRHLMNVYRLAGLDVPDELKISIFTRKKLPVTITPIYSFIDPTIDGKVTSYFEWLAAGEYSINHKGAAMHRANRMLAAVYYGFNLEKLFVRADPAMRIMANDPGHYVFSFRFLKPVSLRIEVAPRADGETLVQVRPSGGNGVPQEAGGVEAAVKDVVEVAVPFALLGAETGDRVDFFLTISREGHEMGHWPESGYLTVTVPGEDFEAKSWSI